MTVFKHDDHINIQFKSCYRCNDLVNDQSQYLMRIQIHTMKNLVIRNIENNIKRLIVDIVLHNYKIEYDDN